MARKIYCNGCNIEPVECIIKGKKQWRWVVTSFIEDCFENGEDIICKEKGKKQEDLFEEPEDYYPNEKELELLNQDLFEGIDEFEQY